MLCIVLVKISLCPGILTGMAGCQRYHHIILIVTVEQESAIVDLFKQRHWMYIKAGKAYHNASLSCCLFDLLIFKREQLIIRVMLRLSWVTKIYFLTRVKVLVFFFLQIL